MLVHSNIGFVPRTHAWIEISIPETVSIERVAPEAVAGWDALDMRPSRRFGDQWYTERRSAVLFVPSVVTGGVEANALIHQDHPDFKLIEASDPREVAWDQRLFRRSGA